jgi:hypothetical protein
MSEPVSTKPRRSSAISRGSQPVCASAPMKMYRPPDSSRVVSPSASRTSIASSEASPCTAATSQRVRVRMFGRAASWSTR